MRVARRVAFGVALAFSVILETQAAPEDYQKELSLKQVDLLKLVNQFNMLTAKAIIDQTSIRNTTFSLCLDNEARVVGQFALNLQNVSNLALVYKIVSNAEEKRQIQPVFQASVAAARGAGQQVVQMVQQIGSLVPCQDGNLAALGESASAIASDVEDTLIKMAE